MLPICSEDLEVPDHMGARDTEDKSWSQGFDESKGIANREDDGEKDGTIAQLE